jgi:hypothetical protein
LRSLSPSRGHHNWRPAAKRLVDGLPALEAPTKRCPRLLPLLLPEPHRTPKTCLGVVGGPPCFCHCRAWVTHAPVRLDPASCTCPLGQPGPAASGVLGGVHRNFRAGRRAGAIVLGSSEGGVAGLLDSLQWRFGQSSSDWLASLSPRPPAPPLRQPSRAVGAHAVVPRCSGVKGCAGLVRPLRGIAPGRRAPPLVANDTGAEATRGLRVHNAQLHKWLKIRAKWHGFRAALRRLGGWHTARNFEWSQREGAGELPHGGKGEGKSGECVAPAEAQQGGSLVTTSGDLHAHRLRRVQRAAGGTGCPAADNVAALTQVTGAG